MADVDMQEIKTEDDKSTGTTNAMDCEFETLIRYPSATHGCLKSPQVADHKFFSIAVTATGATGATSDPLKGDYTVCARSPSPWITRRGPARSSALLPPHPAAPHPLPFHDPCSGRSTTSLPSQISSPRRPLSSAATHGAFLSQPSPPPTSPASLSFSPCFLE